MYYRLRVAECSVRAILLSNQKPENHASTTPQTPPSLSSIQHGCSISMTNSPLRFHLGSSRYVKKQPPFRSLTHANQSPFAYCCTKGTSDEGSSARSKIASMRRHFGGSFVPHSIGLSIPHGARTNDDMEHIKFIFHQAVLLINQVLAPTIAHVCSCTLLHLLNVMTIIHPGAQIWFSFSPSDFRLAATLEHAGFTREHIEAMSEAEREARVASNPVASATSFKHILDAVVRHIIGWDTNTRSAPDGVFGSFGRAVCWFLSVEVRSLCTHIVHMLANCLLVLTLACSHAFTPCTSLRALNSLPTHTGTIPWVLARTRAFDSRRRSCDVARGSGENTARSGRRRRVQLPRP